MKKMKVKLTGFRQQVQDNPSGVLPLRAQFRGGVTNAHYWVQQLCVSTLQGCCRFLREEVRTQLPASQGHRTQRTLGEGGRASPLRLHR